MKIYGVQYFTWNYDDMGVSNFCITKELAERELIKLKKEDYDGDYQFSIIELNVIEE